VVVVDDDEVLMLVLSVSSFFPVYAGVLFAFLRARFASACVTVAT